MENKEMRKPIPVELDEDALDDVSGGLGAIISIDWKSDVTSDCSDSGDSVMSGSMLR